jgi:hypothetical protein
LAAVVSPQAAVGRDKALRNLGKETSAERKNWVTQVAALTDGWIIERRIQLLIDKADAAAAKKFLVSVPFQEMHRIYSRTIGWFQVYQNQNEPCFPIPEQSGGDRLPSFRDRLEFE